VPCTHVDPVRVRSDAQLQLSDPGTQTGHLTQELFVRGRVEGPQGRLGGRVDLVVQPRTTSATGCRRGSWTVAVMGPAKH